MKHRKKNITVFWWPPDDWEARNFKRFRTLKIANRHVDKLMRDGKETIDIARRWRNGNFLIEKSWEKTDDNLPARHN